MTNIIRKRSIKLLCALLILSCILLLAGCGDKVDNIAISESGKPRLTYVLGQELDTGVGSLTVISGSDTTTVPLSDSGVSFSGYNKDQLGKQTVTVTYKGKSTTFEVNVVERMSVSDYKVNYFVGDVFNASTGKVKIMKDSGGSVLVNLNNTNISIEGFDSSKAGTIQVTAHYVADGADYVTTFPVTIHEVGEVTFKKPSKAAYQSHETELSLTGGYFTVTSASDPSYSDYVDITADMISGFDPAAAGKDYKDEALKQTITATYGGKSFQFEISIVYGYVTLVQDAAQLLKDLDWSKDVVLTEEQSQAAYDAINAYLSMTKFDQALITAETLQIIVPAAAQSVGQLFLEEAEHYSQSFRISDGGNLLFEGKSYEQMGIDQVKLANPLEAFNVYADLLRQMKSSFKDMEVREDLTIEEFIKVPSEEEITFYANLFAFLRGLHENMMVIPEKWTLEDLPQYADNIHTAVYMVQYYNLIGPSYSYVFDALASWRTNVDYFEIIYSYFCYVEEGGHDFLRENLWQVLPLPGEMQDWYLRFYNAVLEVQYMKNNGDGDAYLRDTSNFMYYYTETLRLADEIKNGDNQLYKDIYAIINGDQYISENLVAISGGYVSHVNGLIDSNAYADLLQLYMDVFGLYLNKEFDPAMHGYKMEALFDTMADLSATEVFQLICSLQYNYIESGGSYYAMDYTTKNANAFVGILASYYTQTLPENARPIFQQLLLVMENYALYASNRTNTKCLDAFKKGMEDMSAAIAALNTQEKAEVERLLGKCYRRYQRIYEAETSTKEYTFDQAIQDKLDQFLQTLQTYNAISVYMNENASNQSELRYTSIQLFAAYEKAKSQYEELINMGNDDVYTLLCTKQFAFGEEQHAMDYVFCAARNGFVYWMFFGMRFDQKDENGNVVATRPAWDLYHGTQLRGFLLEAADLLLAGFNGTVADLEWSYVSKVAQSLRELDTKHFFLLYGIGIPRYLDCMAAYFRAHITDPQAQELAIAILDAEFGYMVYHALGRPQEEAYFKEQFENVKELYNKLGDKFPYEMYLREMYEFYQEFYNSLA